jgi:hypothetical protein
MKIRTLVAATTLTVVLASCSFLVKEIAVKGADTIEASTTLKE